MNNWIGTRDKISNACLGECGSYLGNGRCVACSYVVRQHDDSDESVIAYRRQMIALMKSKEIN